MDMKRVIMPQAALQEPRTNLGSLAYTAPILDQVLVHVLVQVLVAHVDAAMVMNQLLGRISGSLKPAVGAVRITPKL